MNPSIITAFAEISTPLGLGGLTLFVLLIVLRQILTPKTIPQLAKSQAFSILKLTIDRLFWLAGLAVILGFAGYVLANFYVPGTAKLSDVLIEKTDHGSARIDFRVANERDVDLVISKIRLVAIETDLNYTKGPADYSKVYPYQSIDGLQETYERPLEISVSQVVPAGKADRFGIEVGSTDANFVGGYWKFQVFIETSAGELGGQTLVLTLGSPFPGIQRPGS